MASYAATSLGVEHGEVRASSVASSPRAAGPVSAAAGRAARRCRSCAAPGRGRRRAGSRRGPPCAPPGPSGRRGGSRRSPRPRGRRRGWRRGPRSPARRAPARPGGGVDAATGSPATENVAPPRGARRRARPVGSETSGWIDARCAVGCEHVEPERAGDVGDHRVGRVRSAAATVGHRAVGHAEQHEIDVRAPASGHVGLADATEVDLPPDAGQRAGERRRPPGRGRGSAPTGVATLTDPAARRSTGQTRPSARSMSVVVTSSGASSRSGTSTNRRSFHAGAGW